MRIVFTLLISFFFFACNQKDQVPKNLIEPKKMQSIMLDYINAEVYSSQILKYDSTKNDTIENIKLQNKIFKKYSISKTDFYENFDYYNTHAEMMTGILDSLSVQQSSVRFNKKRKLNIFRNNE